MSLGELESLKIFTLNCWGLKFFSQHPKSRIKSIAQHLSEHEYDIVFLQEVWVQSDFDYIRSKTKSIYTFAHMFNNASILGTSGLVIMAKWIPKMIHFHPYSINGSPFRPLHGDWFSTKGVAYARIELKGFNLHLFCTHMHAQYDEDEKITDQYSIHRVCQSYELAKYINLMACNCSNPTSKDLILLAGDMNTSSKELPYRLLVELTGLNDSYKFDRKKKNMRKKELTMNGEMHHHKKSYLNRLRLHSCSDESSDEELITCGHKDNTFTNPKLASPKSSKRIDFILYKLRDLCKMNDGHGEPIGECASRTESSTFMFCLPEQIKINAKDHDTGLSYSDHQPVASKLNFFYCMKTLEENEFEEGRNGDKSGSPIEPSDVEVMDAYNGSEMKLIKSDSKSKKGGKLKQKEDHLRATQWKQNVISHHQFNSIQQQLYSSSGNKPGDSALLHDIENLLADYVNGNTLGKHILTAGLALVAIAILLILIYFTFDFTFIEMILVAIILLLVSMFCLFLRVVTQRHEIHAVKAILSDISKKKSFGTEYGLLESY